MSLLVQLPLALGLAVLLADRLRGTNAFRLIFFLPYILAEIAAGLIWRFVYDGDYGLLAKIWSSFGAAPPQVLADPDWAMTAILIVIVWKYFGFHMMLYIAGLQQIDRTLYEAARIDGATAWQSFTRVTVPLLGSTIRLSVFFAILGSFQLFDLIMPLTKRRAVEQHADHGHLPLQLRRHAHAGRLRQRGRRGAVRDLRELRVRLQAAADAP